MARVLIVDDDPAAQLILDEAAASLGHETRCCTNSGSALEQLEAWTPHLAMLDIMLPGETGVSLAWRIHQRWPDMPIVMVSSNLAYWDYDDLADCGALHVLSKPCTMEDVRDLLGRLLESREDLEAKRAELLAQAEALKAEADRLAERLAAMNAAEPAERSRSMPRNSTPAARLA